MSDHEPMTQDHLLDRIAELERERDEAKRRLAAYDALFDGCWDGKGEVPDGYTPILIRCDMHKKRSGVILWIGDSFFSTQNENEMNDVRAAIVAPPEAESPEPAAELANLADACAETAPAPEPTCATWISRALGSLDSELVALKRATNVLEEIRDDMNRQWCGEHQPRECDGPWIVDDIGMGQDSPLTCERHGKGCPSHEVQEHAPKGGDDA